MTQNTNDENDNEFTWARNPGSSSESPDAAAAQTPNPGAGPAADGNPAAGSEPAEGAGSGTGDSGRYAPPGDSGWAATPNTPASPPAPWATDSTAPIPNPGPAGESAGPTGPVPPNGPLQQNGPSQPTGPIQPAGQSPWVADSTQPTQPAQYAMTGAPAGYDAQYGAMAASSGGMPPTMPPSMPPSSSGGTSRRQPRRPGWGGVLAVGAGAAALSSLLTAGIFLQTNDSNSSSTTASSSSTAPSTVKAPVSTSAGSAPDWSSVAKAVQPSVVAVKVTGSSASGEGSGVILDKTGRIVTNNHVVSGVGSSPTIQVVLQDGRTYPATVVGTDSSTDLAVIKLTDAPTGLTPAVFGNTNAVAVGDPVMALGNPLGLSGTVTTGIISATDRPTTTEAESTDPNSAASASDPVVTNAIQTDAAVNPGNSGGALVNAQGEVIGIPSSIASLSDSSSLGGQTTQSGSIGLGFAIPIDEVKDVTSQLIKGGTVAHSWLGVTTGDGSVKIGGATQDTAELKSIVSGSPAQKAGLKTGDSVVAVDGKAVNSELSLVGLLREEPVNTTVTLTVIRDGKSSTVKVTLGTRPSADN